MMERKIKIKYINEIQSKRLNKNWIDKKIEKQNMERKSDFPSGIHIWLIISFNESFIF